MKQVSLIKPDHLARPGMRGNRLPNLASPQPTIAFPLPLYTGVAAILLDDRFLARLKNVLPCEVEAVSIISHST